MKVCPKCQGEYDDKLKFCPHCGEQLVRANVCPKCGKDIEQGEQFCPFCGFDLSKEGELKREREKIDKYRNELKNLSRKKTNFLAAGWLCFGVGLFVFILCLVVLIINAKNDGAAWIIVFSSIGLSLSDLVLDVGIILIIVGYAVFSKKISNREKAIREYDAANKQ